MQISPDEMVVLETRAKRSVESILAMRAAELDRKVEALSQAETDAAEEAIVRAYQDIYDPQKARDMYEEKAKTYVARVIAYAEPVVPEPPPIVVRSLKEIIGPLEPKDSKEDIPFIGSLWGGDIRERNRERMHKGVETYNKELQAAREEMERRKAAYLAEVAATHAAAFAAALGDD